ncbi:hypothetical protein J2S43_003784 [Catenuloplanes nepalensis]|uniref:LppX_LprAFG lipoprotein n=1 Tax=Catenuloplanes nepalensis TaxID=587533 RepID=A0ABT9MV10_9ACTN|nr:hypothetical protein [Catenuloplanes nepalensis]MDP9795272.1 hypothetical protein [Catenuloplanes nepalensis]
MKKQLRAVSAVLIALALGACGAEEEAPEDPFTALDDSVVALLDGNYTFKHATTYQVVDGSQLADAQSMRVTLDSRVDGQQFTSDFVTVAGERFVLLDFSKVENMTSALPDVMTGEKWVPLTDPAVTELGGIPFPKPGDDVVGATAAVRAVIDARETGDNAYAGTLDLTQVGPGVLRVGPTAELLAQLGDAASAVPFTATLDGEGRLLTFVYDVPAAGAVPANHVELTLSGYGASQAPAKPDPAEVANYDDAMKAIKQQ